MLFVAFLAPVRMSRPVVSAAGFRRHSRDYAFPESLTIWSVNLSPIERLVAGGEDGFLFCFVSACFTQT